MKKILYQLQLSNYDRNGKFILTADSNWQIFVTKAIEMIKLNPNLDIVAIIPENKSCNEDPYHLINEFGLQTNVSLIEFPIISSAPVTRYDFPWKTIENKLFSLHSPSSFTHVYNNDPMLLPHYKALFHVHNAKPKFILQTHFLDSPKARIVDDALSYWYGTIDACHKADVILWHCNSMQRIFDEAIDMELKTHVSNRLKQKSYAWKDGYSDTEIRKPVNEKNLRFDPKILRNKTVVWVPNRVGGLGKSFDYTNNGRFLFEFVPELWKQRKDFVVIAGNPNQKITNDEIAEKCPAYVKLVDDSLNRDEYRWLSRRADIVVGLYTNDTNGGLASLEAITFNAVPLFPNVFEYKHYFDSVNWPQWLSIKPDLSNTNEVLSLLLDSYVELKSQQRMDDLRKFIYEYASYESTTPKMMKLLNLM